MWFSRWHLSSWICLLIIRAGFTLTWNWETELLTLSFFTAFCWNKGVNFHDPWQIQTWAITFRLCNYSRELYMILSTSTKWLCCAALPWWVIAVFSLRLGCISKVGSKMLTYLICKRLCSTLRIPCVKGITQILLVVWWLHVRKTSPHGIPCLKIQSTNIFSLMNTML